MSVRKATATESAAKRRRAVSSLVGSTGSKSNLADILHKLEHAGVVGWSDSMAHRTTRRMLSASSSSHARASTPYGTVISKLVVEGTCIDIIDPAAYLHYMATLSPHFADMMYECLHDNPHTTYVMYNDGLCPGNPFRPDKARKLEAFYWCIPQWHDWVLTRSLLWPTLLLARQSLMAKIPGGLCTVMARVVEFMQSRLGAGVVIPTQHGPLNVVLNFGGFLGDLLAIKAVTGWKGTGGVKACMECANVVSSADRMEPGDIDFSVSDTRLFVKYEDNDIWGIVDALRDACPRITATKLRELETDLGFNHIPQGLFQNEPLRSAVMPSKHFLRDWMHCIVGDGIGNWCAFNCVESLKTKLKIPLQDIQAYVQAIQLPKAFGKLSPSWLDKTRFRGGSLHSFASYMLSIIPALHMFLDAHGVEESEPELYSCFDTLHMAIQVADWACCGRCPWRTI